MSGLGMQAKLKFKSKNRISSDIWQLHFEKPAGFTYKPGQYLEAVIPDPDSDERGTKRWFTMSSSPTQADIIITTRLVSGLHSEFKDDLFHLGAGDTIDINGPDGDFTLPSKTAQLLWIGGGIGVTPFISQLQYLLDTKDLERDIVILHGIRSLDEDPCAELVKRCRAEMPHLRIERILSEDIPKDWPGETGYITAELIKKITPNYLERQIYVSGPEPMVDAMKETLLKIGVGEAHIHQDWFPGYKEIY